MLKDNSYFGENTFGNKIHHTNLFGAKRIVSSWHLVSEKVAGLSKVECGLILSWNAFGNG